MVNYFTLPPVFPAPPCPRVRSSSGDSSLEKNAARYIIIGDFSFHKEMMMRKGSFVLVGCIIALMLLGSCFSVPSASPGSSGFSPFGGLRQSASDRANAEIASATGLTGMTQKMMFNVVYSQVFYVGGFGAGMYPLEETQGAVWRMESRDENNNTSKVEAERALLKKLSNGDEWWYLAWRQDGEAYEFEALMNSDSQARKIRYYNPDVKRIEEAVFKDTAASSSQEAPPPEPASSALDESDLAAMSKGRETLRLNSGTFDTERLEWSAYSEDEKATYNYNWWVDRKTAGGLVKYEWTKSGSKERLNGELYSLKKGYKTKFNSF